MGRPSSVSKAFCGAAPTPICCNSASLRPKSPLLPVHLIKTPNKILVFTAFVACQYRFPPPHLIPPIFAGPPDLIQCVQVRSRSREASIDQPPCACLPTNSADTVAAVVNPRIRVWRQRKRVNYSLSLLLCSQSQLPCATGAEERMQTQHY